MQAVKDQFDARRHSQPVEDFKEVIAHDSGSNALGFGVAFLGLGLFRSSVAIGPPRYLFPFLVAGLPLLDAALAVIRRLRSLRSPFYGDRFHVYDLLLAHGWSPRHVALVCYGVTCALAVGAWIGVRGGVARLAAIGGASMCALLMAAIRLGALGQARAIRRRVTHARSIGKKKAGSLA